MEIYALQDGQGFVIASYRDGQYTAAMDAESKRLTGCYAVFARTPDGLAPNTTVYRQRSSARRALKRQQEQ